MAPLVGALTGIVTGATGVFVLPAVAGMAFGQMLRARIDQATFCRMLFVMLLALGAALVLR